MWPRQTHCGRSTSSATLDPEKFDCMQILTNNKCQKSLEYLGLNLTSLLIEQLCTVHHLLDGIIQYLTHLTLCAIAFRRHDMARYRPPWPMAAMATPHELLQRSCQGLPGHKALVAGPRKAATCSGVSASGILPQWPQWALAWMAWMAWIPTPEPPWNCDGRQEQEDLCCLDQCESTTSK